MTCECGQPSKGPAVYLSSGVVFPCADCRGAIMRFSRLEKRAQAKKAKARKEAA